MMIVDIEDSHHQGHGRAPGRNPCIGRGHDNPMLGGGLAVEGSAECDPPGGGINPESVADIAGYCVSQSGVGTGVAVPRPSDVDQSAAWDVLTE